MTKRTRATSISAEVKRRVSDRDGGECIFCHRLGNPEAHVISRAQGGLGIEQNIITVCRECHERMDASTDRPIYVAMAEEYLRRIYGEEFDKVEKVFRKGNA